MASEVKAVYLPSDNTVSANESVVATACQEKQVPIYTSYGGNYCYASLAIDYYELGRLTGMQAAQILLEGKKPADIEIGYADPAVTYNEKLCKELGIAIPEK